MIRGTMPFEDKDKEKVLHKTLKSPVNLEDEEWEGVSQNTKNLVRKMLHKD